MKLAPIASACTVSLFSIAAGQFAAPGEHTGISAPCSRLLVVLRTSDVDKAGTDADIDFGLTWTDGPEKRGEFFVLPQAPGNNHEKGSVDVHAIKLDKEIPVGDIQGAQIVNEMGGDKPGWHVHSVTILAVDANDHVWLLADAPVNKWLERVKPSLCAMAVPIKTEPKDLGVRKGLTGLTSLSVSADLPEKKLSDMQRSIGEAEFKSPVRTKTWNPD